MSNANPKTRSKTKAIIPGALQRSGLFGPPPLLKGEDAAAYDELFAGIRAAVNPIDTVVSSRRGGVGVGGSAVAPPGINPGARVSA